MLRNCRLGPVTSGRNHDRLASPDVYIVSLRSLSLELLKLIPGLRVLWIEFQGFLEVLDRALLFAFCVFHLRYRLIGACRLREILQIGLQIGDRIVGLLRRHGALRDRYQGALAEVVLLAAVVLGPELAKLLEAGRSAAVRGLGDDVGDRPRNRKAVMAHAAKDADGHPRMTLAGRPSSPSRFADYGRKHHVDRISQQDHLTRNSLLPLVIRGEVEPPVSLDMTVIALHAERVVKSIHELQDHRPRSVFRPDLQIRHRRWALLASSALRVRQNGQTDQKN